MEKIPSNTEKLLNGQDPRDPVFEDSESTRGDKSESIPQNNSNSLKKSIRKLTGIVGIGAMSLMQKESNDQIFPKQDNYSKENTRTEWSKQELSGAGLEKAAVILQRISEKERNIELFVFASECLSEYEIEYLQRQVTGKRNIYDKVSDEELQENIDEFKGHKEKYKNALDKLNYQEVYEKNLPVDEDTKYYMEMIKGTMETYDIARKWLLENIKSEAYKNKMHFNSIDSAFQFKKNAIQGERARAASEDDFILTSDMDKSYQLVNNSQPSSGTDAFYLPSADKVFLKMEKSDLLDGVDAAIHEYSHKITNGNNKMTFHETELLSESFDSLATSSLFAGKDTSLILKNVTYLSDPTEIFARKKVFDYDLERLGVKKYGETFTPSHYLRALELMKQGKLMYGSSDFLRIIKPKYIERVMNKISDNNIPDHQIKNQKNSIDFPLNA